MRNRFYTHPSDDIVVDVDQMFNVHDGIIAVGVEDVHQTISGADNVIVLSGKATGSNRVSNAIEDAVLHTCSMASGYDLFSADKVLVKFIYPKNNPLVIGEIEGIHQFADMFSRDTHIIWGISERNDNQEAVVAQIVASNLQKK